MHSPSASNECALTIRGVRFKNEHGRYIESHNGKPGIELSLGCLRAFIGYEQASLIARGIERLGTSGNDSINMSAFLRDTFLADAVSGAELMQEDFSGKVDAQELVETGQCSGSCLVSPPETVETCTCTCDGLYHSSLSRALVERV